MTNPCEPLHYQIRVLLDLLRSVYIFYQFLVNIHIFCDLCKCMSYMLHVIFLLFGFFNRTPDKLDFLG